MFLPFANVDKLMREAKVDRISKESVQAMTEVLEKIGIEITKLADEFSRHANRTTIKANDVHLAFKIWKKQQ